MTDQAVRITSAEFRAEPSRILAGLFRGFDPTQAPFQDAVKARLIIRDEAYLLSESQFQAVCKAAASVGDDHLLYTIVRADRGPDELTWRLPLSIYAEYEDADVNLARQERIGIPLERVLYSPLGTWGIMFDDFFALVGGSLAFVDRFRQGYPGWRGDLESLLAQLREAAHKPRVDVSWVQPLMRHLYGNDGPTFRA